jgi:hypothetical protein
MVFLLPQITLIALIYGVFIATDYVNYVDLWCFLLPQITLIYGVFYCHRLR